MVTPERIERKHKDDTRTLFPTGLSRVGPEQLRRNLFYLSKAPLPYRKLSYTIPGHATNTLYEADDFIQRNLESWGYSVEKEGVQVQPFGCDTSKPKALRYAPPASDALWYTAYNLYAKKQGAFILKRLSCSFRIRIPKVGWILPGLMTMR